MASDEQEDALVRHGVQIARAVHERDGDELLGAVEKFIRSEQIAVSEKAIGDFQAFLASLRGSAFGAATA